MRNGSVLLWAALSFLTAGCGTYVPDIQEAGDDRKGIRLVHAIVDSVHCELRNAINIVIKNDEEAAQMNGGVRYAKFLEDWAVQVTLSLQVEERTEIAPIVNWVFPLSLFTLNVGPNASSTATRIDTINYFYTVKDLFVLDKCDPDSRLPHVAGSLLIRSNLKTAEWLLSLIHI